MGGAVELSPPLLTPFAALVLHTEIKWKQPSWSQEVALGMGCGQGMWEATALPTRHTEL